MLESGCSVNGKEWQTVSSEDNKMKITKSQVQVLYAPADEQLVDVQPKDGGM